MRGAASVILTVAIVAVVLHEAPSIEREWWPVLRVKADQIAILSDPHGISHYEVGFSLVGKKLRSCELNSYSIGWRYDRSILPTVLMNQNHQTVSIPTGIQVGEVFNLPFRVPVPTTAIKTINPRLLITYYYNCHGLYLTEQDLTIPVPINDAH